MKQQERKSFKELLIERIDDKIKNSPLEKSEIHVSLSGFYIPGTDDNYKKIDEVCEYFEKQGWSLTYYAEHSFFLYGGITLYSEPQYFTRYIVDENYEVKKSLEKYREVGFRFRSIEEAQKEAEYRRKMSAKPPIEKTFLQKLKHMFK